MELLKKVSKHTGERKFTLSWKLLEFEPFKSSNFYPFSVHNQNTSEKNKKLRK